MSMPCYHLSFVRLLYLTLTSPYKERTIKERQKEHTIVLRDSHPGVEGAAASKVLQGSDALVLAPTCELAI